MYCKICRNPMEPNDNFCARCGNAVAHNCSQNPTSPPAPSRALDFTERLFKNPLFRSGLKDCGEAHKDFFDSFDVMNPQ